MDQRAKNASDFAKRWAGIGDEKQDSQRFWIDLLQNVYGVAQPADFVRFEQRVKLSHTSFIDVMIPATHTMIEQKSLGKDLNAPIKQSDGTFLKPFEQAKRYAAALPYSERPRWIVSCNFSDFQVYDMERPNDEPQHIELKNLSKEYYRLNFMVDVRDSHIEKEMELSRKAGELVGRIYNVLLPCYGPKPSDKDLQDLNKFIVRLVFCFYAEDAGLFNRKSMFHDYMESFNPAHFRSGLIELFRVLDQPEAERDRFMEPRLAEFPYVNGSLFTEEVPIPLINEPTRRLILDDGCGFDWSGISPTIFGAIFESTLNPETRRHGGMHYTSIENIHKVIDPLFLDDYKAKFHAAMQEKQTKRRIAKLKALQDELASGRYFDPACGSGNFLTESYLSLRRLENDILRETLTDAAGTGVLGFDFAAQEEAFIKVSIQQFYGIEINDFAVSVAKTAMWIAESQMFRETEGIVNREMEFLPLHTNSNIHEGNALQINWRDVLTPSDQVNLLGNPPFVGGMMMSKEQKADIQKIFAGVKGAKAGELDYVSCWYKKAIDYIKGTNAHCAFVSTNSITQGQQATTLWKSLMQDGLTINFAYRTFVWTSESKRSAAVHCVIIGFSAYDDHKKKTIYSDSQVIPATHINSYLIDAPNFFIESRNTPLCEDVPHMFFGSMPRDGGGFKLTKEEKETIESKEPLAKKWIHPYLGSYEFINKKERWCLWLVDASPSELQKCPLVMKRILGVKEFREKSVAAATRKFAKTPTVFCQIAQPSVPYIAVPKTSSQLRRYIPMGFLTPDVIASDLLFVVPDAKLYHFGLLESNVHMAWMRTVAGRLKSDYRYAKDLVYNNFPWPKPTAAQQREIEATAQAIITAREKYPTDTLAQMYGTNMFLYTDLLEAHRANDRAVMRAYGFSLKMSESECVAALMRMYQKLIEKC